MEITFRIYGNFNIYHSQKDLNYKLAAFTSHLPYLFNHVNIEDMEKKNLFSIYWSHNSNCINRIVYGIIDILENNLSRLNIVLHH